MICRADLEFYKEIFGRTTLKIKRISRVGYIGESTRLDNSEEKMNASRKEAKTKMSFRCYEKLSNIKDYKTTKNKLMTKAFWVAAKVLCGLY